MPQPWTERIGWLNLTDAEVGEVGEGRVGGDLSNEPSTETHGSQT